MPDARAGQRIAIHLLLIVGIALLLVLCIAYPFLSGGFDRLAVPLSNMAQLFGIVGLALVPVGLVWLALPRFAFALGVVSTVIGTGIALVFALFATLSVGNAFGVLTLGVWVVILVRLIPKLKSLKRDARPAYHPTAMYLVSLPLVTLAAQVALKSPLSQSSKARAIANANEFIGDIEQYHTRHRQYPVSLQAQNRDYHPDVVGVERYIYVPQGDSYNLSFEQPRFLLDRFGTREWVVYNPRDAHRVYSHTNWLLPPPEVTEPSQGWYASGETGFTHWKFFLFD